MEIRLPREALYRGLSRVQGVADVRAAQPILANVLMEAADGALSLTATDYEIAVKVAVEAQVVQSGRLALNARRLYEVVRELPEEDVYILSEKEHWASLKCGRASFRLAGLAADDFPPLPAYDEEAAIKLPADKVREMVEKTLFAVSTDTSRYVLNGVLLSLEDKKLEMVATDGHRLAQIVREGEEAAKEPLKVVIPRKALHELTRLLEAEAESLQVVLRETHITFLLPKTVLIGRLIEGQFPNYEQVIPERCATPMTVERHAMMQSLKRVSLMASDKAKMVKLSLSPEGLTLSSEDTEIGAAEESLPADYSGGEIQTGFNARYLLEALGAMETDEVVIDISDPLAPGLFEPADGEHHKCVIMPMRI